MAGLVPAIHAEVRQNLWIFVAPGAAAIESVEPEARASPHNVDGRD